MKKSILPLALFLSFHVTAYAGMTCDAPFEGIIVSTVEKDPNIGGKDSIHIEYGGEAAIDILPATSTVGPNGTTYTADVPAGAIWVKSGTTVSLSVPSKDFVINKSGLQRIGKLKLHLSDETHSKTKNVLCD